MGKNNVTKAERIRREFINGKSIAEIAKGMGLRYQHVRNTIKSPGSDELIEKTRKDMQREKSQANILPSESEIEIIEEIHWNDFSGRIRKPKTDGGSYAYYEIFKEEEKNYENQNVKRLFQLMQDVFSYRLVARSAAEPFQPMMYIPGTRGRTALPSDLSKYQINLLERISSLVSEPEMKARLMDVLWVLKRDVRAAKEAIDAYSDSGMNLFSGKRWSEAGARVERGFRIALQVNDQNRIEVLKEKIVRMVKDEDGSARLYHLMSLLPISSGNPKDWEELATQNAERSEAAGDIQTARQYWDIAADVVDRARENERANQYRIKSAETYLREADFWKENRTSQGRILEVNALGKAIEAFRHNIPGQQEKVAQILRRLDPVQKESVKTMPRSVLGSIDLSTIIKDVTEAVRGKNFIDAVAAMASFSLLPSLRQLEKQVDEIALVAPLISMLPADILNRQGGRVSRNPSMFQSDPEKLENAKRARMIELSIFSQQIAGLVAGECRKAIWIQSPGTIHDWEDLLKNNPFIPPGREKIFAQGLYAGYAGDFLASIHILIPQIENSLRYILSTEGVVSFKVDDNGGQEEKNLSSYLSGDLRINLQQIFSEDLIFNLEAILISKYGPQLRHKMAHGLLEYDDFQRSEVIFLWWLTIRMCFKNLWKDGV